MQARMKLSNPIKVIFLLTFILLSAFLIQSKSKIASKLTEQEKQEIISVHNQWRAEVGVDSLQWSNKLASEAQAWANKLAKRGCRMKHSKTNHGENIYWSTFTSTPKEVVDAWGSEKKYYRGRKIKESKIKKYGHYTQLVWSKTKLVGCGRAKCRNGNEIWVCTYSPAGNYIGEYPYKKK